MKRALEPAGFQAMGVDVAVSGATEIELASVRRLFATWEQAFSRFRPDSELSRVNRTSAAVVVVSDLFAEAVRTALGAAQATDGLVDPTLGRAIEAAGYNRDFSFLSESDERPLDPTAPGRWRTLRLSGRLLSRPPGTLLDLNGVVKALAVDAGLARFGRDGFVAAGGDIATRGGVVIGLPRGGSLRLVRGGVATSGATRRSWRRGGAIQHHLLDPRTGRPAESRWEEVTVAASSCVAADVAAKAAFLLSDVGPGWLDERGLPGRFVTKGEVVVNRVWRDSLVDSVAA